MGKTYIKAEKYLKIHDSKKSIFLEIGSERDQGSTTYFVDLAKKYNVDFYSVDIKQDIKKIKHLKKNKNFHLQTGFDGTEWCKKVLPTLEKKVSVLYLDNFDYNFWPPTITKNKYNNFAGSDWPQFEILIDNPDIIEKYNKNTKKEILDLLGNDYDILKNLKNRKEKYLQYNIEYSNTNSQIEHFKQLLEIYPYLDNQCVIVFDDTARENGAWVGKNGPGVVFLLAKGFTLVEEIAIHPTNNHEFDYSVVLVREK